MVFISHIHRFFRIFITYLATMLKKRATTSQAGVQDKCERQQAKKN